MDWYSVLSGLAGGAQGLATGREQAYARTRQATLDKQDAALKSLQLSVLQQQAAQGQDTHDLTLLHELAPLARVARGTAPTPTPSTVPTDAPGQGAFAGTGVGAPGFAAPTHPQPASLADFAARPMTPGTPGDAPDRYVQQGGFYADTGRLDPKTAHDLAMQQTAWNQLKQAIPSLPEWMPGMDASKLAEPFLAHGDRVAALAETQGYHTQELGLRGQDLALNRSRLGVEQGRLGVDQDRLAYDRQFGKPMERTSALAGDYNHLAPVEDADKFAANAAMALEGVRLARARNPNGQLMAITGFLRQTHPDAVVRTNDKGMLMEVQGVPAEMQAWFNRAIGKGGLLNDHAMREIEAATQQMIATRRQGLAPVQQNFGARARAMGADSSLVVRDPFASLGAGGASGTGGGTGSTGASLQQLYDQAAAYLAAQGQSPAEIARTLRARP